MYQRIRMTEDKEVAEALRAMERAARIARRQAAEKNLKMPVWRNGAIVYIDSFVGKIPFKLGISLYYHSQNACNTKWH